jgi:hypothetical protein
MDLGPTTPGREPFTSEFGAVPTPEEPARRPDPEPRPFRVVPPGTHSPHYAYPWSDPARQAGYQDVPPVSYSPFATQGPQANAAVVNNIRLGGGTRGVNHGLHFLLTVLTCGLWAPVWLILWIGRAR